ncbi:MAG: hypothetical protein ACRENS_01175, partial [Candidatus Eiseniibacteriota bacterium]
DSAFLSFICVVTAAEALSGYRYGGGNLRSRFVKFVKAYFPDEYLEHAEELYTLRKGLVHAFSTGNFDLTHHQSHVHLRTTTRGRTVLNAEDLYSALLVASRKYFVELEASLALQTQLMARLDGEGGGSIGVYSIAILPSKRAR